MEDVSSLHRHFRLTSYIGASTTSLIPRSQRRWMRIVCRLNIRFDEASQSSRGIRELP